VNLNFHVGAELTGLSWNAVSAQQFCKAIYQGFRNFGQGSIGERGAASFSRICIQGELRDNNRLAMHIQHRKVEFPLLVFKNPQVGGLLCKKSGVFLPIAMTNAKQNQQPPANL